MSVKAGGTFIGKNFEVLTKHIARSFHKQGHLTEAVSANQRIHRLTGTDPHCPPQCCEMYHYS